MRHTLLAVALVIGGCGSEEAFECSFGAREGVYFITYEQTGDCGPLEAISREANTHGLSVYLPSVLTNPAFDCRSETTLSEDLCNHRIEVGCLSDTEPVVATWASELAQQDEDAEVLLGFLQLSINIDGDSCHSSYDVMAVRVGDAE